LLMGRRLLLCCFCAFSNQILHQTAFFRAELFL
jgi:hypothetical protein